MQRDYVPAALISLLLLILRGSFPIVHNSESQKESPLLGRDPSMLRNWARSEILFYGKLKHSEIIPTDGAGELIQHLIKGYLIDFERSNLNLEAFPNGTLEEQVTSVTSNPTASVFMIRRAVNILSKLRTGLKKPDPNDALPQNWPRTEDLSDALLGLLRLCHVYNLDLKSVAAGELQGIQTGIRLTSRDLHDIGTFDMNSTEYIVTSIKCLELAYQRSKIDQEIDPSVVKKALYDRIILHDEKMTKFERENFFGYSLSQALRTWGPFHYFLYKPINERWIRRIIKGEPVVRFGSQFQALCRHGSLLSPRTAKDLFCWYERRQNPYFAINPLKAELVLSSPNMVQFHNVIGENTIRRLKEMAMSDLRGSKIYIGDGLTFTSQRTSVSFSFYEREHAELRSLLKTVELISGLRATEVTATEALHMSAYTFSGFCDFHYDMLESKNASAYVPNGSRIATIMYYLEEPKLGGYTAFPKYKVAVRPVKGSVLFWYNMLQNGGQDPELLHGGCPVILGEKWVGTKWILQYDQFLGRKCTLKKDAEARFQPFLIPASHTRY